MYDVLIVMNWQTTEGRRMVILTLRVLRVDMNCFFATGRPSLENEMLRTISSKFNIKFLNA